MVGPAGVAQPEDRLAGRLLSAGWRGDQGVRGAELAGPRELGREAVDRDDPARSGEPPHP